MTISGRRLPLAGIAEAIDCVIATKGWSRPTTALQAHTCECPRPDRKTDIADEAIIVRRGNHLDGPFSQAQPGNWSNISGRLGLARDGHVIMTYHVIH
jgi:hypothetical protein